MPLIKCKTCGTKFTGFECPDCGRHLSARGCLLALLVLAASLLLLSIFFPSQLAPRIEMGARGQVTYVFESFRHSSRSALSVTLFILFVAVLACRIRLPHTAPPTPSTVPGLGGASAMMFGSLGRVLRSGLLALLTVVLISLVVLKPLGEFRALTVTDTGVQLHSLYHTRRLPFEQIVEATTSPDLENLPTGAPSDLYFIIKRESRHHRSVRVRLARHGPRRDSQLETLRAAIPHIHRNKDSHLQLFPRETNRWTPKPP